MDTVDQRTRSRMMSKIGSRNTRPELAVRRVAHRLGYRFRLNRRDLPGTPDIVFPGRRKVVFVHGCYWHRHADCRFCYQPKSNVDFWTRKFEANVSRDKRVLADLSSSGWDPLVIWECQSRSEDTVASLLNGHLGPAGST